MRPSVAETGRAAPADDCPLCLSGPAASCHRDRWREYLRCPVCTLVFVPARYHLAAEQERRRYELHRNTPRDPAYRRFLARLFEPVAACLPAGAHGLDYGSGPGPTLSLMFEEAGFPMRVYDPYFAPVPEALRRRYDFVVCSETAEHFCRPAAEWRRLAGLLRPGGCLGVMTQLLGEGQAFAGWYYKEDPTHVCFYTQRSVEWIATTLGLRPRFVSPSVFLLESGGFAPPGPRA